MEVTMFRGLVFTAPAEQTTLDNVLNYIRSDKWKSKIDKCKIDTKNKTWLPCFTPTGKFTHRSIKGMVSYNGIICLDIDHVEYPQSLKKKASELSWVHAAFITPSYKGLKILVKTDASVETFREAEEIVANKFFEFTGFQRDNHCKDIARIQYVSHDPDLYRNLNSEILLLNEQIEHDKQERKEMGLE